MQDNIENVITNSLTINKVNLTKEKIINIINQISKALNDNQENIFKANDIDIKNNNGFKITYDTINQILKNIEKTNIYYGDTIYSERNNDKKYLYGKYYSSKGTVLLITEGNTYILLELILKNIIANNTLIINTNGYMYGTNKLLLEIITTVLENNGYSKNQVQICVTETSEEILKNYTALDLVLCIGSHNLQTYVQRHCQNELILSGYENFDIYLETTKYMDLINKIIEQKVPIQFYINNKLNIDIENAIPVENLEEAIAQINFNGSHYSTAIFTEEYESGMYFLENIKSKIQTINTSPTIERICDIKVEDLIEEKTIIYPINETKDTTEFQIDSLYE